MGKNNNNNNNRPPRRNRPSKLYRRARGDVKLDYAPFMQGIQQALQGVESAYGGAQDFLAGMPALDTTAISNNLNAALGGLQGMGLLEGTGEYGTAMPGAEQMAGNLAFGGTGAGAHELLANDASRWLGFQQSGQREANLAERAAKDNLIQQRLEMKAMLPKLIRQRADELRDQRFERMLARSQMESDEAWVQFMMDMIGDWTKKDGKGKDGKGKGNHHGPHDRTDQPNSGAET